MIDVFEGDAGEFCARILNESVTMFDRFIAYQLSVDGTATGNLVFLTVRV